MRPRLSKSRRPNKTRQLDAFKQQVVALEKQQTERIAAAKPLQVAWEPHGLATLETAGNLNNGLFAQYRFDEGKGEMAHDSAGNFADAKITGKVMWGAGKSGNAVLFDGTTALILGDKFAPERTDKFSYGAWINPASGETMTVLSKMDESDAYRGFDLFVESGRPAVHLIHKWPENAVKVETKNAVKPGTWTHVFITYNGSGKADGVHIYLDGKAAEVDVQANALTDTIQTKIPLVIGRRTPGTPFKGLLDDVRIYSRELTANEVASLADYDTLKTILALAPDKRTKEQADTLTNYYLNNIDPQYPGITAKVNDARKQRDDYDAGIPTCMVMQEQDKPRDTFLLLRGQYDQHGEKMTTGTPAVLPPLPANVPPNRLALAEWLVAPTHPLTSRVQVNRLWQMLFGTGIVKTCENFGLQGELPSHPELLDYLATEFIRTKWDMKQMVRLMVTSATYRQSADVTPAMRERDPENRLLAHAPRFRLPAEMLRDQALAVSGLLVEHLGGPSVKTYQPAGLWEEIAIGGNFTEQKYVQDHGDKLYRRTMYTFWKRSCPPPSLQTLDAPEREFCIVRRSVTNTPLQSLVLMNDPVYVESSRKFAERILLEGGSSDAARLVWAFRMLTARVPTGAELSVPAIRPEQATDRIPRRQACGGETPSRRRVPPQSETGYVGTRGVGRRRQPPVQSR